MELEYVCKENIRCLQTVMQQNNSRRGEKSLKRVCGKYDHNVIHQPTLALLLYGIAVLVTALSGFVFHFMS